MVSDVLGWIDYSVFAEAALVLFLLAFAAVSIAMAKVAPRWSEQCAAIPLTDGESKVQTAVQCDAAAIVESTK